MVLVSDINTKDSDLGKVPVIMTLKVPDNFHPFVFVMG